MNTKLELATKRIKNKHTGKFHYPIISGARVPNDTNLNLKIERRITNGRGGTDIYLRLLELKSKKKRKHLTGT